MHANTLHVCQAVAVLPIAGHALQDTIHQPLGLISSGSVHNVAAHPLGLNNHRGFDAVDIQELVVIQMLDRMVCQVQFSESSRPSEPGLTYWS